MIHFTKYSEKKFDVLNKHDVYFTKEQIEDVMKLPDDNGEVNGYLFNIKDNIKVIYKKEAEVVKVVTFYPIKI